MIGGGGTRKINSGVVNPVSDLSVTKTDSPDPVSPGGSLGYTITVTNTGPNAVSNALVTDNFPASLSGVTWTCSITSSTGGSSMVRPMETG